MSRTGSVEVEVKLGVERPRRIARLLREWPAPIAGFEADGAARRIIHVDRYLDTADEGGALLAQGVRARLRRIGRATTLTVKRPGVERDSVTTRPELEAPASQSLDPASWRESEARRALDAASGGAPLREIARLRQDRLTRLIRAGTTIVELSLDRVDVIDAGRLLARRHELEAELVDGDERALARLAAALTALPGLGPAAGSKLAFALGARAAQRGLKRADEREQVLTRA